VEPRASPVRVMMCLTEGHNTPVATQPRPFCNVVDLRRSVSIAYASADATTQTGYALKVVAGGHLIAISARFVASWVRTSSHHALAESYLTFALLASFLAATMFATCSR